MKMKCDCKHEAQDKMHGAGIRVFNKTEQDEGKAYRCTVCLAKKQAQGETKK